MKNSVLRVKEWIKEPRWLVWIEYGLLSLAVLLPLLLPGYILTLDLVFTPHFSWPNELTNTYPLQILLWLLHLVVSGDVIEKIILFLILLLSGVGMHKLIQSLRVPKDMALPIWQAAAYFAGILYIINPFTYSRFMGGQWMVLLGYALVPFFVLLLLRSIKNPSRRTALQLSLCAFMIAVVSLHHIGIMAVLGVLGVGGALIRYRRDYTHLKRFAGWTGVSALLTLGLSSYWLIPAAIGHSSIAQSAAGFNGTDFAAFATTGSGVAGAIGNAIRLEGFWAEAQKLYVLPQAITPVWGIVFLLLWILIVIGGVKAWHTHRMIAAMSIGGIVIGVVLASTPLIAELSRAVPLLGGYREPQKFVNLIVLGYGILGTFGVAYVAQWTLGRYGGVGYKVAIMLCLVLPLVITPTMLWGFGGQLAPRSYPAEWYEMNATLKKIVKPNERVLFLPWHQYARYSFSNRLIANPAEKFFEVPVIVSDDPEFRNISPTVVKKDKRKIADALTHPAHLVRTASQERVKYIMLAKEQDFARYTYLNQTAGIRLVNENAKLKLYKVESQ